VQLAELVRRFDDDVRAIAGRGVKSPDAVEEVVQQTFYLAFRNLDRLRDPERLEAWIHRIARNAVVDHYRRRARRRTTPLPAALPDDRRSSGAAWIWEEVAQLGEAFDEVLRLRYREGRSYAQIARRLDVPVSTVRGRLHEARKALRRRLTQEEERS
jgi:RNA polymerase sigma-70 factor (ECF subfamily)